MILPSYVIYFLVGLLIIGGVAVVAGDQILDAVTNVVQAPSNLSATDSVQTNGSAQSSGADNSSLQTKVKSVKLEFTSDGEGDLRYYDATLELEGIPKYVEYVQLDVPPYVYRPQGGAGIYIGYGRTAPIDQEGKVYATITGSKNAYHRGFFVATWQNGERSFSENLYITPESTNPDATLTISLPSEVILTPTQDFNFVVDTSEGISMAAVYIHVDDNTVKYYGTNYSGFIPESTNVADESTPFGTEFTIKRSKFEQNFPIGVTEFEMQIVILDKAYNVFVSEWFKVKLE